MLRPLGIMTLLALVVAPFFLGGATCDSATSPPAYDLSSYPLIVDLSRPPVQHPTCMPPGNVICPSGTSFRASPSLSGCFDNGSTVPGEITSPVDNPSGPCPGTDNVVSCDTPPTCSFCLKKTAAIPPGCYAM
jgi:hypothetical protein